MNKIDILTRLLRYLNEASRVGNELFMEPDMVLIGSLLWPELRVHAAFQEGADTIEGIPAEYSPDIPGGSWALVYHQKRETPNGEV